MKVFTGCFILVCSLLAACSVKDGRITAVVEQEQLPVLINKSQNKVLAVTCCVSDTVPLRSFEFGFDGTTDVNDIERVSVRMGEGIPVTMEVEGKDKITIPVSWVLDDTTVFIVTCDLKEGTGLSHRVDVQCTNIRTDKGNVVLVHKDSISQRVGCVVRDGGQDGVNTYRIPGIATTKKGTLLAVYDVRRESSRDLQGNMDIGLSRSVDGGQTWEPMRIVLDMGTWGGLPEKFNGVSDACILVDDKSGTIFVAGLWMHGVLDKDGKWIGGLTGDSDVWQHQWRGKGSQPGLGVKETSQFLIAESRDDGQTWGEPKNITGATKVPEWWLYAPAPGQGITMSDGTLVFPTQGRDRDGVSFSNITYSKDGGKSWKASLPSYTNTTECAVVELPGGGLMLNMRDNRNGQEKGEKNGRAIFTTVDMGNSWQEHPTSHSALVEPVCMASLHRHDYIRDGKKESLLLFSNPDSKYHRNDITLKVSFDGGDTWCKKGISLDAGECFGYSCITSLNDNMIGVLYESSRAQMVFQSISLDEVMSLRGQE